MDTDYCPSDQESDSFFDAPGSPPGLRHFVLWFHRSVQLLLRRIRSPPYHLSLPLLLVPGAIRGTSTSATIAKILAGSFVVQPSRPLSLLTPSLAGRHVSMLST